MKNFILKDLIKSYNGVATIIPCQDLIKIEDSDNELREQITEAFMDECIFSNWDLKEGAKERHYDEDYSEEEQEDVIWQDLICSVLNKGFIVIYKTPVPRNIVKDEKGKISHYGWSWGYTQTSYLHLEDLSNLSTILINLDEKILEEEWNAQQKREKSNELQNIKD